MTTPALARPLLSSRVVLAPARIGGVMYERIRPTRASSGHELSRESGALRDLVQTFAVRDDVLAAVQGAIA